ncbi:prepilin-type N-terminal cleavage/methylation domain-containing protein [Acidiferrobacter sp.]|uniref:type II secretion system protein n=1 Tax=Acidiferrobacter sp. TaxID=1872107 RepID=UPI00344DE8D6
MKRQQAGFTLIELVVVIIILGILAAVALPKFMGLSTDARVSVVSGMTGSVAEAADMVHALAEVQGQTGATGSVTLPDGTTKITTAYGYPDATATGILVSLQDATATPTQTFPFTFTAGSGTTAATFAYTAVGGTANSKCEASYLAPAATGATPTVGTTTSGC